MSSLNCVNLDSVIEVLFGRAARVMGARNPNALPSGADKVAGSLNNRGYSGVLTAQPGDQEGAAGACVTIGVVVCIVAMICVYGCIPIDSAEGDDDGHFTKNVIPLASAYDEELQSLLQSAS